MSFQKFNMSLAVELLPMSEQKIIPRQQYIDMIHLWPHLIYHQKHQGWVDINGDKCFVYDIHKDLGCPLAGWVVNEEGIIANEACCYCDDALTISSAPSELPSTSFAPTKFILRTGSLSISALAMHSLIDCVDREGWENICSFNKSIDTLGCPCMDGIFL